MTIITAFSKDDGCHYYNHRHYHHHHPVDESSNQNNMMPSFVAQIPPTATGGVDHHTNTIDCRSIIRARSSLELLSQTAAWKEESDHNMELQLQQKQFDQQRQNHQPVRQEQTDQQVRHEHSDRQRTNEIEKDDDSYGCYYFVGTSGGETFVEEDDDYSEKAYDVPISKSVAQNQEKLITGELHAKNGISVLTTSRDLSKTESNFPIVRSQSSIATNSLTNSKLGLTSADRTLTQSSENRKTVMSFIPPPFSFDGGSYTHTGIGSGYNDSSSNGYYFRHLGSSSSAGGTGGGYDSTVASSSTDNSDMYVVGTSPRASIATSGGSSSRNGIYDGKTSALSNSRSNSNVVLYRCTNSPGFPIEMYLSNPTATTTSIPSTEVSGAATASVLIPATASAFTKNSNDSKDVAGASTERDKSDDTHETTTTTTITTTTTRRSTGVSPSSRSTIIPESTTTMTSTTTTTKAIVVPPVVAHTKSLPAESTSSSTCNSVSAVLLPTGTATASMSWVPMTHETMPLAARPHALQYSNQSHASPLQNSENCMTNTLPLPPPPPPPPRFVSRTSLLSIQSSPPTSPTPFDDHSPKIITDDIASRSTNSTIAGSNGIVFSNHPSVSMPSVAADGGIAIINDPIKVKSAVPRKFVDSKQNKALTKHQTQQELCYYHSNHCARDSDKASATTPTNKVSPTRCIHCFSNLQPLTNESLLPENTSLAAMILLKQSSNDVSGENNLNESNATYRIANGLVHGHTDRKASTATGSAPPGGNFELQGAPTLQSFNQHLNNHYQQQNQFQNPLTYWQPVLPVLNNATHTVSAHSHSLNATAPAPFPIISNVSQLSPPTPSAPKSPCIIQQQEQDHKPNYSPPLSANLLLTKANSAAVVATSPHLSSSSSTVLWQSNSIMANGATITTAQQRETNSPITFHTTPLDSSFAATFKPSTSSATNIVQDRYFVAPELPQSNDNNKETKQECATVLLRQQLSHMQSTIRLLQQKVERLENENNQLRQLPTGKISQIPVEDMLEIMHEYGSEVSDTSMPPRKSCIQKASIVRQFRRWNPNFLQYFEHSGGKWVPKYGKEAELKRREQTRREAKLQAAASTTSTGTPQKKSKKRKKHDDQNNIIKNKYVLFEAQVLENKTIQKIRPPYLQRREVDDEQYKHNSNGTHFSSSNDECNNGNLDEDGDDEDDDDDDDDDDANSNDFEMNDHSNKSQRGSL